MASLDADPVYLHRLAYWVERGGRGGGPPTRLTAAAWEAWGRRLAREGKEAPPPTQRRNRAASLRSVLVHYLKSRPHSPPPLRSAIPRTRAERADPPICGGEISPPSSRCTGADGSGWRREVEGSRFGRWSSRFETPVKGKPIARKMHSRRSRRSQRTGPARAARWRDAPG